MATALPQVVLYIACSLDGYIATADGGIDWLPVPDSETEDFGYGEFYDSVAAVLMGRRTYEQVLGFGDWPYGDKPCWVFSRRPLPPPPAGVTLTAADPAVVLQALGDRGLARVWLVGGSALIQSCRAAGLIHEYFLTLIPTLLGAGIPLFPAGPPANLTLLEAGTQPGGVVQLRYGVSDRPNMG